MTGASNRGGVSTAAVDAAAVTDRSEHVGAEVSTQALVVFWDWLAANGVALDAVFADLEALGWERAGLLRRGAWVPHQALLDVEGCVAARFPDREDLFHSIGMSVGPNEGLGFLRTVSRTLFSPHLLYHRMPGMMRRFLFRFMTLELHSASREHIVGEYQFDPGCPPSDAFLETARGVLTGMPVMLGAPPARVDLVRTGPLSARADIYIAAWGGPVQAVVAALSGLWLRARLTLRAPREAGDAILEANRLLQDQVAEVNTARAELAEKVRDLEALRARLAEMITERTSELEHARAQLEGSVRRLERASAARTTFFTNVSHEFKTPLTLILAAIDELDGGAANPSGSTQRSAAGIRRHAQTLLRLINELLDLARIDAGRMPLRVVEFDVREAIIDMVSNLRPMASARRTTLSMLTPEEPVPLQADRTLVLRALVNLIVNAIKYAPEGAQVEISLSVHPDLGGGERISMVVADDGPGIPTEQQSLIFQRFSRGAAVDELASDGGVEGTGIGLALVAEIVELHHGDVQLDSAPGQGARFTITLPRTHTDCDEARTVWDAHTPSGPPTTATAETPHLPPSPPEETTELDEAHHPDRATVLVVDDNPELRAYLGRVVAQRHGVLLAQDGAQALDIAQRRLPDLVLTDVMMPVLDGYELCRALKADPTTARIPVILITARHGPEALIAGFDAQADDFVRKPFSADELLARIATHLRIRQLTTQLIRAEKSQLLGTLSSGMAHEVLNPVNAQLQAVRLLRDPTIELAERERAALLGAIERGGQRIERIVRSVQTFARRDSRKAAWRDVHLSAQIEGLRPLLEHRLSAPDGLQVHVGVDPVVRCQPDLIDQVLTNLILNGLDAADRVSVTVEALPGGAVEVAVADDGAGVPTPLRERIFTPFFTTKEPGLGTGMGLAIAREIADLHGGSLELAAPRPGEGARFVLRLPGRSKEEDT